MRRPLPEPTIEGGPYDFPTYRQWNARRRARARVRGTASDRAARFRAVVVPAIVDGVLRSVFRPSPLSRLFKRVPVEPDEVIRPGVDYRQREADRAAVRDAVRAAGGGQPWLLPSPEGLEAMGRAKRGPGGRPIPNNPSMRKK